MEIRENKKEDEWRSFPGKQEGRKETGKKLGET